MSEMVDRKPEKDDRVEYVDPLVGKVMNKGTVVERGKGRQWSLRIRWDGVPQTALNVHAWLWWEKGTLRMSEMNPDVYCLRP